MLKTKVDLEAEERLLEELIIAYEALGPQGLLAVLAGALGGLFDLDEQATVNNCDMLAKLYGLTFIPELKETH